MIIHITVKHGRFSNEVFTSTEMANKGAFSEIVNALKAKGFNVNYAEFEYTQQVALRVVGLKSDKAVAYASDIVVRSGRKAGFAFLSAQHH